MYSVIIEFSAVKATAIMKNTARKSRIKTVLLMAIYIILMTFFVIEDQNIFRTLAENFHSLSIYKPF